METNKETYILFWLCFAVIGVCVLTGCSFKFEFGYHGETALDNNNFTPESKKNISK